MFRLGFLGGGQMAEMMIGGLKDHAADFHLEYLLYDPVCSRRQYMLSEYGVNTAANNAEVLEKIFGGFCGSEAANISRNRG